MGSDLGPARVLKLAHANHELERARMVREAEAMVAIGAPAVPRVFDAGVTSDGRAWITMQRIAGTTLADLTMNGPCRPAEAIQLGIAILDALVAIHAAGFAHRDLKPDNLVRTPNGAVVILDLGLARKLPTDPDDPTRAGVQVGSLEYMPPEQARDSATADERSDIYAFGCVLYELVTGRPPFLGDAAALERAHQALRPPPARALATVSAVVESLCQDCLAKRPELRPTSAAARARLIAARDEQSPVQMTHSMSMIREGKQPVVLLWAELPRVDRALLGLLAARKLTTASQRGRRVLAGALATEHPDPAAAAIAAARELVAAGARVALHLDAVGVGSTSGVTTLHGAPVEQPETWLPTETWTGVVMTGALASVAQVPTRRLLGSDLHALAEQGEVAELFGREALLTDLVADAAAVLRAPGGVAAATWSSPGPAFALAIGDPGAGKTAFATELARRLRDLGARVHIGAIPAPGSGKPGASAFAELIGTPDGPIVRGVGDALRAIARREPLAVIVDDLHYADHDLLDALEYATLGGEPLRFWLLGIAGTRLEARRVGLGTRADRHRRDVLGPLDDDAAVAMATALLRPADYPPLRALRRLTSLAHGNPLHLSMLVKEVHGRGAIRPRPGGGFMLDTSALDDLEPIALGPWLAARQIAGLAPEVVALARVCAVLGGELRRSELAAVLEAVERRGGATTTVDLDVGLRELVGAGVLVANEGGWRFAQPLVEDGLYATTDDAERRAIHEAALELLRTRPLVEPGVAERVAAHAEAVGTRAVAAEAFAMIGEVAEREHRALEADQAFSGAVRNLDAGVARACVLLGRGRARYRLQRMRDALDDFAAARAIAADCQNVELELAILTEQATAYDWSDDYARSAGIAAEIRQRRTDVGVASFAPELALAEARIVYRNAKYADAVPLLQAALELAKNSSRVETETVASVLLAPALVEAGRLSEAEVAFEHVIRLCTERGDRFHLGAAYANRTWLWAARGELDRVAVDLGLVIQLAREDGQASLERIATYNLAEEMLWQGRLDGALQLARRALSLQQSHGEGTVWPDQLILARTLAARGDDRELLSLLESIDATALSDEPSAIFAVLRCAAERRDAAAWSAAIHRAYRFVVDPLKVELANLAAAHGALAADDRANALALAQQHPVWSRRIRELALFDEVSVST